MDQSRIQSAFFIALFTIVVVLNFFVFKPYFAVLLIALTLAVIFSPVHKRILKEVKHEGLAAFLTTILVFMIVLLPITYFGQKIFFESRDLYFSISGNGGSAFVNTVVSKLRGSFQNLNPNISQEITAYVKQAASSLFQNFGSIFSSVVRLIFTFILMMFSVFFLLKDGERLKEGVYAISPFPRDVDENILEKMRNAINSVIRGQIVVAIVQGLSATAGMTLFGVPNPVLWGSVVVIAALIPTLGTSAVMIPVIAYLYLNGHIPAAIGMTIWSITAIGLVDNFLGPVLINRGLKIHPFIVLLSVIGGISAFGMVGFILGPLILTLLIALFEIRGILISK